jgi:putative two-component system hydrogenase maturation factor HypX/HoxX
LHCRPLGTRAAREIGFLDDAFGEDNEAFEAALRERARGLTADPEFRLLLRKKHDRRLDDESIKPLVPRSSNECRSISSGLTKSITRLAGASSRVIHRRW